MRELKRMIKEGEYVNSCFDRLHWWSDWNGDEVGYDHILVVGLYGFEYKGKEYGVYIDVETMKALEVFDYEDEEY